MGFAQGLQFLVTLTIYHRHIENIKNKIVQAHLTGVQLPLSRLQLYETNAQRYGHGCYYFFGSKMKI